jgi:hypothetical protein
MKHIRFFEEFSNKRKGVSAGNVVAAFVGGEARGVFISGGVACVEALGALIAEPNSPVVGTSVSLAFLRAKCKRVSEARARKVHPALFQRIDADLASEEKRSVAA